jgi:integrase
MARRGDALFLRGKTWYLCANISGVRHQLRLGKSITRKVALELAQVQRGAILKGELGIGKKAKDLSFDEARKKFEAWAEASKKPGTFRHYQCCLRQLAKSFSGTTLGKLSTFAIEKHKQGRVAVGALVVINRELSVLRSLFNLCKAWQLYEGENPVENVKMRKEPQRRLRFLEPEEEVRLLAACGEEQLRSLILLGVHTGLRIQAEALQLRWEDVDLPRGFLTVQSAYAKNNRTRSIPLNSVVRETLEQLQRTATGDRVFTCRGIGKKFRTACATAKLTGVTPHTLRHTFATRLVMSGVDLRSVMELGGWSDLTLVQRYSHVSPGRMERAVEGLVRYSTTGTTTPDIRRIGETA